MSRKRVKQYLTLLMAIGVIAVVAGGSGTFASFNAEVTNTGNTFANGTLLLHDNGGTNTCTSESASTNLNDGTNGDTCDTFFSSVPLSLSNTTLGAAATAGTSTSITLASVASVNVQPGDQLTISDGTHTDVVTATSVGAVGSSVSVNVTWNASTGTAYTTSATVSRDSITAYATLKLTNAGTLPASDIKYGAPTGGTCQTSNSGYTTTASGSSTIVGGGPNYSIPTGSLPTAIRSGQTITLTHSGTSTTWTVASAAALNASAIVVTSNPSAVSGDTIKWGPQFGGSVDPCTSLEFVVIETGSAYGHDSSTKALGCAVGTADPSNGTNGVGCDFDTSSKLSGLTTTQTALTLASGGSGNTKALDSNGSRYFVVGVRLPTVGTSNDYQGRTASFGLTWHIDQ